MYYLDANSLIEPWKADYNPVVFPTLWRKLRAHSGSLILIDVIEAEIEPISHKDRGELTRAELDKKYPLRRRFIEPVFTNTGAVVNTQTPEINREALLLEQKYQTAPKGKSRGASKADIRLIAYARRQLDSCVVTLESRQEEYPGRELKNFKIPLICERERVSCINFVEMLGRLGISL